MMVGDHGDRYAAVSCYNSLKIGGGAHTLVRLNLKEVVLRHNGGIEAFLDRAKESGFSGLIIPDLPPEEADSLCALAALRETPALRDILVPTHRHIQ